MITSISIEKSEWTKDGLPACVKLSFTIKDLYSDLMLSKHTKPQDFFKNESLMNFLMVSAGVNILLPNLGLKIEMMTHTLINTVVDIPGNWAQKTLQNLKQSSLIVAVATLFKDITSIGQEETEGDDD